MKVMLKVLGSEYEDKSTENYLDNEPVPLTSRNSQPRKNFSSFRGYRVKQVVRLNVQIKSDCLISL